MVFREPKVEFVNVTLDNVIATSGLGAEYCKEAGDPAMTLEQFCATMTSGQSTNWTEICKTTDWDPSTSWRPGDD